MRGQMGFFKQSFSYPFNLQRQFSVNFVNELLSSPQTVFQSNFFNSWPKSSHMHSDASIQTGFNIQEFSKIPIVYAPNRLIDPEPSPTTSFEQSIFTPMTSSNAEISFSSNFSSSHTEAFFRSFHHYLALLTSPKALSLMTNFNLTLIISHQQ